MVDRIIKISEQQLHTSCPVAESIKYHKERHEYLSSKIEEYARDANKAREDYETVDKARLLYLNKISVLESQIENLKERVNELEDLLRLISDTSDKLENLLYGVRDN